jgi:hypothetical protein
MRTATVELHICYTYTCEQRNEGVVTAPSLPTPLPKTTASPSLLACEELQLLAGFVSVTD